MALFEVRCCINSIGFSLCLLSVLEIYGVFLFFFFFTALVFLKQLYLAQAGLKITPIIMLSLLSAEDLYLKNKKQKKHFKIVENSNFIENESQSSSFSLKRIFSKYYRWHFRQYRDLYCSIFKSTVGPSFPGVPILFQLL